MCLSLEKGPAPSTELPVVLCLGMRPGELSYFDIISIDVVLFRSCLGSCVTEASWV